jgi:hypothetical protein
MIRGVRFRDGLAGVWRQMRAVERELNRGLFITEARRRNRRPSVVSRSGKHTSGRAHRARGRPSTLGPQVPIGASMQPLSWGRADRAGGLRRRVIIPVPCPRVAICPGPEKGTTSTLRSVLHVSIVYRPHRRRGGQPGVTSTRLVAEGRLFHVRVKAQTLTAEGKMRCEMFYSSSTSSSSMRRSTGSMRS